MMRYHFIAIVVGLAVSWQSVSTVSTVANGTCLASRAKATELSQDSSDDIVFGQSIGGLVLGDTEVQLVERVGSQTESTLLARGCRASSPVKELHWIERTEASQWTDRFAYLREGRAVELWSNDAHVLTALQLSGEDDLDGLRRGVTGLTAYQLQGSNSDIHGGRDLIYWVSVSNGVAFELTYHSRKRRRIISSVIIFAKGTGFEPHGCVEIPQRWLELSELRSEP